MGVRKAFKELNCIYCKEVELEKISFVIYHNIIS